MTQRDQPVLAQLKQQKPQKMRCPVHGRHESAMQVWIVNLKGKPEAHTFCCFCFMEALKTLGVNRMHADG